MLLCQKMQRRASSIDAARRRPVVGAGMVRETWTYSCAWTFDCAWVFCSAWNFCRASAFCRVWAVLAWATIGGHPLLADDLFEGLRPGLIARYSDGTLSRSRIESTIAGRWDTRAPLDGIAPQRFRVEWSGVLFVRSDTTYRFHAHGQGRITLRIGDQTVLEADSTEAAWHTGPATPLEFGFLPLTATFEKTAPEASLQVGWSSEQFPLEPLPHHLLLHGDDDAAVRLADQGRKLFDAHRCNRCHVDPHEPLSPEAPPFIAIAADLNPDWLVAKLEHRHSEAPGSLMPSFGFSRDEATAVGAWLWQINQPPRIIPLRQAPIDKKNPPPDGLTLVQSIGCLACHQLGELGFSGPFGGGDLSQLGAKRTADWIYTWLGQPDRINPEHRMPTFKLLPTERSQIASALSELGRKPEMTFERPRFEDNTQIVAQGRELSRQARCFNCHKTPAVEIDTRGLPALDRPVVDWSRSCLADAADIPRGRPFYPQADRAALRAYVEVLTTVRARRRAETPKSAPAATTAAATPPADDRLAPEERLAVDELGRLTLERRNCLACHERDGAAGIVATAGQVAAAVPQLRGQSEALIPPNLTAVGDKLLDAALADAVGGDQKQMRMPWLQVRMPKYNHSPAERAALTAHLIAHDRILAGAPATIVPPPVPAGDPAADPALLGRQLVGVGGLSCIACHAIGEYEPRNTALGTRGSDLKEMGARLRPEFFLRWCRAPLRIVPGVEMPSYGDRPAKGILGDNPDAQLAALWTAINDPRLEAPTNPSQVEQLLAVAPDAPPRVLRDVFTVSKENGGGYVPRAFAIGFSNGHSLLFDLDRGGLRDWTFGEFARQRTEGKSWYWDLAGAPIVSGLVPICEFVERRGDEWIRPDVEATPTLLQLRGSSLDRNGVLTVSYRLAVPGSEPVEIDETWRSESPSADQPRSRIIRSIRPRTAGRSIWFVPSTFAARALRAEIAGQSSWPACGEFGPGIEATDGIEIVYAADAGLPVSPPPPRPEFPRNAAPVTTAPGFVGERLPLPTSLMPTALAFDAAGTLAISSLKGQVHLVRPTAAGEWQVSELAEGLSAPFGVWPDSGAARTSSTAPAASRWLVVHKPELIALEDADGDGLSERREVLASGWGFTDNYHDWSAGPVRDAEGNLYVATSSDYAQPGRPERLCQWRGKVLRIAPDGSVVPIAHELRYPMGIAFDPQGRLFVSDQQGVANCFNEIDQIIPGERYGVKGLFDPDSDRPEKRAAIQIPHPWTRSVNGIFFIPDPAPVAADGRPGPLTPFAGHGIGCEYNGRFLIRFSLQDVGGELQGATYPFTRGVWEREAETFLGPICGTVAPNGDLLIGSIHDSGWLGGLNVGELVRLRPKGEFPNGIRELRATPDGFEIEFLHPVDPDRAVQPASYSVSGYTRVWKGSYATEDSGRHAPQLGRIDLSADARTVRLQVDRLEAGYVYDIAVQPISADGRELFPHLGHYTLNRIPTTD